MNSEEQVKSDEQFFDEHMKIIDRTIGEQMKSVEQLYLEKDNQDMEVKTLHMAAEQGDAEAQQQLGVRYKNGEGVIQNAKEAVKWYRKATEQGNVLAQYCLGECYFNGEGVEQNYEEAVKWYRKAADQKDEEAEYR